LCCVCFYFVALDVSLGFHFLLYVCYVNPAYGCQTEINCVCALRLLSCLDLLGTFVCMFTDICHKRNVGATKCVMLINL